jgi:hypothetical protein
MTCGGPYAVSLRRLLVLGLTRQDEAWGAGLRSAISRSVCPAGAYRPATTLPIGRLRSHHRNSRPDRTERLQHAPRHPRAEPP